MPFQNEIHTDKLLSNISLKYKNSEYIADLVFPVLNVEKDSDLFRVFTRNFRIPYTRRANKGLANEFDFHVTNNSYKLERHALKDYVSDNDARNYDVSDLRADTTENLTDALLRRVELTTANLFTTTNWSLNVSLATAAQWGLNTTTSDPIPLMDTAATTIIANSGYLPNFAIIPRSSFIAAKNHVNVLDRVKYTSKEVDKGIIAALFSLPEILVPTSVQDTSAEGLTDAIAAIWSDNVFVGFKPPRPSPLLPSCGYIFKENKAMVKRWRDEERSAEAVEVEVNFSPKIVASLAGYLIRDVMP